MAKASTIAHRSAGSMLKGAGRDAHAAGDGLKADHSSSKELPVSRGAISGNNAPSHVSRFNG